MGSDHSNQLKPTDGTDQILQINPKVKNVWGRKRYTNKCGGDWIHTDIILECEMYEILTWSFYEGGAESIEKLPDSKYFTQPLIIYQSTWLGAYPLHYFTIYQWILEEKKKPYSRLRYNCNDYAFSIFKLIQYHGNCSGQGEIDKWPVTTLNQIGITSNEE